MGRVELSSPPGLDTTCKWDKTLLPQWRSKPANNCSSQRVWGRCKTRWQVKAWTWQALAGLPAVPLLPAPDHLPWPAAPSVPPRPARQPRLGHRRQDQPSRGGPAERRPKNLVVARPGLRARGEGRPEVGWPGGEGPLGAVVCLGVAPPPRPRPLLRVRSNRVEPSQNLEAVPVVRDLWPRRQQLLGLALGRGRVQGAMQCVGRLAATPLGLPTPASTQTGSNPHGRSGRGL